MCQFSQRRQENGASGESEGAEGAAEAAGFSPSSRNNQQRLKIDEHLHQLANVAEEVETICLRLLAPCVNVSK